MKITKQLKEIRKGKKLFLRDVALNANISPQHLSLIERGQKNPTIQVLERITEALGYELRLLVKND